MILFVSPLETVILRLRDLGAFQFLLPFMLTSAVFYGLLRKSQIFGPPEQNVAVNAIVALIAAFMVFSYPILAGVSIEKQLAAFMFQSLVAVLTVAVSIIIAGAFLPENVGKFFSEKLGGKLFGVVIVAVVFGGIGILFSSGLSSAFFPQGISLELPQDVIIGIISIALLVVLVAAIVIPGKK
ncbi:MAG: hypothetical protein QXQ18_00115 [Candidatus Aenigmatarchaeota archaeon]